MVALLERSPSPLAARIDRDGAPVLLAAEVAAPVLLALVTVGPRRLTVVGIALVVPGLAGQLVERGQLGRTWLDRDTNPRVE